MLELVKDYYGRQLSGTADLKTTACCDISELPDWLKPLLARPGRARRLPTCGRAIMDHHLQG